MNSRLPFYPNIQATDDVVINLWEVTDILELAKRILLYWNIKLYRI